MKKFALLLSPLLLLCEPTLVSAQSVQPVNQAESQKLFPAGAAVRKLAGDQMFVEGPVWMPQGGFLVYSDINANQLKRWDASNGVRVYRDPSNTANGNTLDLEGRLVTAQHDGRVTRTEADGSITTIADNYEGRHLSSPNDVVVKSDGTIWFTDPDYGVSDARPKQTAGNWVYRYNPLDHSLNAVVMDFDRPNGLCFSPDEKTLYVADSGMPRHIRAFTVYENGYLSGGRVFAALDNGAPDGIRCDQDGRVWSSAGDGVQVFSRQGQLLARILLPEPAANLAWGGQYGRTLYMTARTSLYAVDTLVTGAARPR